MTQQAQTAPEPSDPKSLAWLNQTLEEYLLSVQLGFQELGESVTRAAVYMRRNPETGEAFPDVALAMLGAIFCGPDDAKQFAFIVREHVLRSNAVAVIFSSESWMSRGDGSGPHVEPRLARDRREGIIVVYDHIAMPGPALRRAFISREGDKATLGAFEAEPSGIEKNRSRLGGMLPDVLRIGGHGAGLS